MRLKTKALFILLAVVFLLPSCKEEVGTTALKLILKSDSATRLISNQSADIDHFKVLGTGPVDSEGKNQTLEVSVTAAESSATLSGLKIGNWTFEVTAYNSENTPLMTGSLNVNVTSRPSPVTIDVNTPVGTGDINLDITWSAPEVETPKLKVYLRGPSMESAETSTVSPAMGETAGEATYQVTGLVSGTYVVRVELYDDTTLYGGKIESVKVFKDITTTGSIKIVYDTEYAQNGTGLTLQTNYGRPVNGTISCSQYSSHVLYVLESATLDFSVVSTEEIVDSDYTVEWYYDGIKQTSGITDFVNNKSSFTFKPLLGIHIVNVLCYNKNYGSVGTAEWSFSTVARGENGSLYRQREISADEGGVKIGSYPLIGALDNEKFLVLSKENNIVQVCGLENNTLKVYSSFSAGWLANAEQIFSTQKMNAFAISDNSVSSGTSQENITLFMSDTSESSASISVLKDSDTNLRRYSSSDAKGIYYFTKITSAGFVEDEDKGGTIYFADCGDDESTFTHFGFSDTNLTKTRTYAIKQYYTAYESTSMDIMGSKIIYNIPNQEKLAYEELDEDGDPVSYQENPIVLSLHEIPVKFVPTYVKAITNTSFIISDGYSRTCYYKLNNGSWMLENEFSHPSNRVVVSEDSNVYMLDCHDEGGDSILYSYSLANGTLTELNQVSAKYMTDIACSDSMVLACTSDGKLIFCKVVEEE